MLSECFNEKSIQALARAIPPNSAKAVGRELEIENKIIEKMYASNQNNATEFMVSILLYWKQNTKSDNLLKSITEALTELDLGNIAEVVGYAYSANRTLRASDFRADK